MEETLRHQLLRLFKLYCDSTGLAKSVVGRRMLHDSSFFARLERGDGFNVKTFDRAVSWFAARWPEGLEWPDDLERPTKERAA